MFIDFGTEEDACAAKLLLRGMCFTDVNGQLKVCQVQGPQTVKPRTEEEQLKCKRARVDEVTRENDPEIVKLRAKQMEQDQRMQELSDRIEGTNTRITYVMGQLRKIANDQKLRDLQASREWHDVGEFDYAAKQIAKNKAKRVQKGENLYTSCGQLVTMMSSHLIWSTMVRYQRITTLRCQLPG